MGISRGIEEIASGISKQKVEFPGVIKKKSCGISRGFFVLCLSGISRVKVKNLKMPGFLM